MSEEQLAFIKERLNKFFNVVKPVCEYWSKNLPHLATLSVLIQNIQFSGVGCVGYSHEESVKDLKKVQVLINSICNYKSSHLENWIKDEINSIIDFESKYYNE